MLRRLQCPAYELALREKADRGSAAAIGTLSAFAIVCIGVLVLRVKEPERPRPFRVPGLWFVSLAGAAACLYTMYGLPRTAWERFAVWLVLGALIYLFYGYRRSKLRSRS